MKSIELITLHSNKRKFKKDHFLLLPIFMLSLIFSDGFSSNLFQSSGENNDTLKSNISYQLIQVKLGINLGYHFPYSCGLEVSCLFNELVDVNVGCGLGISGAKIGFGSRIYPLRTKKFSPLFGLYLYYATGFWEMEVKKNNESAVYRISPDYALLPFVGFRIRFGKGQYFTCGIGYVFPYFGKMAAYQSGSHSPDLKKTMDAYATGGVSVNAGILIKLNRGNFKK